MVRTVAIEQISSPANPRVKTLRALERKKTRLETGLFIAEGPRLVQQGLDRGWHLDTLAVAEASLTLPHIDELVRAAISAGAFVFSAPERVMSKIARKDNPNAVVGAFAQQTIGLEDLAFSSQSALIALYEVRDPGNLGTILRTADCAGIAGVILVGTCCDRFSIEAVRASMGSIFDVPVAAADFDAFDTWRRAQGRRCIAASMNGTVRHDEADLAGGTILLMGNEQSGLPHTVETACDVLVRIPMRGGADSLNLAQATAILTYEAWRQAGFDGAAE
ncbi:MAG: RNA methyltransferase [Pseudomonadota bacterium]